MSFVFTDPEMLAASAGKLAGLGSAMAADNAGAAGPITEVTPPAADLVSAWTAARFALHAHMYQEISAQAAAVHEQMVAALGSDAGAYTTAEAANAAAAG